MVSRTVNWYAWGPLEIGEGSFCPPKNFVVKRVERYTTSLKARAASAALRGYILYL